jgi:heme oxygenase
MYVLEGATLGGQIVLQHVQPFLGIDHCGATFFASYGERVGAMWRAFCDRLERLDQSEEARGIMITSACSTFESLHHWLFDDGGL